MIKRRSTNELTPGLRTCLSEFEAAVREHAFKGSRDPEEFDEIEDHYDKKKQQLLRKLLRNQELLQLPSGLSVDERRLLVLAMGMASLSDLVVTVEDDELVGKMETQLEDAKAEFNKLLETVDQPALVEKLT